MYGESGSVYGGAADRGSVPGPLRSDQPPGESQPPGSGESQPLVAGELQPLVAGESQLLVVAELSTAPQVWVDVTSAAGSLTARAEYPGSSYPGSP